MSWADYEMVGDDVAAERRVIEQEYAEQEARLRAGFATQDPDKLADRQAQEERAFNPRDYSDTTNALIDTIVARGMGVKCNHCGFDNYHPRVVWLSIGDDCPSCNRCGSYDVDFTTKEVN